MNEEFDKEWEAKLMSYARELPLETLPSRTLEERTVKELRARGVLRRRQIIPTTWLVGSIAASLALFAMGVGVGQYIGARSTANMFVAMRNQDAASAAAQVQQAGTAYVQAMEVLVNTAQQNRVKGKDNAQAREVALTALHAAANQVVRIAPNDPVVAKILQGIEQEQKQVDTRNGKAPQRNVVWF